MTPDGTIHKLLKDESLSDAERRILQELEAAQAPTPREIMDKLSKIELDSVRPLVRIPGRELPQVRAMDMPERRAWHAAKVERKALRKRQREARKRQRR